MSAPKKKDQTNVSEVFSIDFSEEEPGGIPGVTQLLSPGAMKHLYEKKQAEHAQAQQGPLGTNASQTKSPIQSAPSAQKFPTQSAPSANQTIKSLAPGGTAQHEMAAIEINLDLDGDSFLKTTSAPQKAVAPTAAPSAAPTAAPTAKSWPANHPAPEVAFEKTSMLDASEFRLGQQEAPYAATQLIQADATMMEALKSAAPMSASRFNPNATTLAEFGVHFVLEFQAERGSYVYARMKPHKSEKLAVWQEQFFFQMRVDFKALQMHGMFAEWNKDANTFQADAFGLGNLPFVQVVRFSDRVDKVFVLLSEHSLAKSETKVRELLGGKPEESSGEFKIELAS